MSTASCCLPVTVPLHRPWWQRALDALREHRERRAAPGPARPLAADERSLQSLAGLSAGLLRDIGAPDAMVERARRNGPHVDEARGRW